ncbi:sialidase family protein [Brevibacillus parabrevis]|uniref:sialidase family protein n=1 Tax=Brevibacillus parabrevis TaxID=54914 RepID=UPI0028534635|nr:sialidase family protein [Brevibacillus parabrevis]MDR4997905.1 sialidase family protein [Brevibacillus parabrevis]
MTSTVINSAYDTSGNGGRKLVRLNSGVLVCGVYDSTNTKNRFYKSSDSGQTWIAIGNVLSGSPTAGFALVTNGTDVFVAYAYGNGAIKYLKLNLSSSDIALDSSAINIDITQTSAQSISMVVNSAGTELHLAVSTKNSTYPNSFNIRHAKGTIDGSGNVTWGSVEQLTLENSSGYDYKNPCIIIRSNGYPSVIFQYTSSSAKAIRARHKNANGWSDSPSGPSNWLDQVIYSGGSSYDQSNPCAVVDGNGLIHVVWHGKDATDSSRDNTRYSKSTDGGATWSAAVKLTSGNTEDNRWASISVNKENNLYVYFSGAISTGTTWNIKRTNYNGSIWAAVETLTNNTGGLDAWNPSLLDAKTLSFTDAPVIYSDKATSSVKFRGTLNQNPTLTLTSPADNLVLAEGSTLQIGGSATDSDNGNVVTIKYRINGGTIRNIASGVSDGSTPLSFARDLRYSGKRMWDGAVDVAGADLAENTDHTLAVWAEDDKGGKSAEVTRKFRVVWNRPPTISDENRDLGIMEAPPSVTYTVTEPEGNAFTVAEKINGQVIRTFAGVAGQQETITIPHELWIRLEPGVQHALTIEASDDQGMMSTRTYTLTRFVDKIVFSMDYATMSPETKDFFTTDVAAKRLLLTPSWDLPPGAVLQVEVCNNAYDEDPSWEDATIVVKLNRAHLFANETKTATEWGINFRIRIEQGSATQPVYLKGIGGAFD